MVVHLEFDRLPLITQLDKVQLMTDRPHLTLAYQTLQRYTQLLASTEKAPLLTHHYFVQGLAGFHLTGDITELAEFSRRFDLLPPADKQGYVWQWACTLFRAQEYQRVLDVLEEADSTLFSDIDYIRYHALFKLGDPRDKETLNRHLERLQRIDTISFDRVLRYLAGHCTSSGERNAVVDACLTRGQLDDPLVEWLLRAEIATQGTEEQEQLAHCLAQAEPLLQADTPAVFRQHLASLFQHAENYTRSAEILQGAEQAPGPVHPGVEIIRLRNQYHLFQNSGQLRDALRAWRLQHGVLLEFCSWEVELAHWLLDWERIVEVTSALKDSVTAKSGARWAYLSALYKLERPEELQIALEEVAQRPELLTFEQLLDAAAMAHHQGLTDLALELVFPLAMDPENVTARTRFFALCAQDERPRTPPEVGGVSTAVLYALDGKRPRRLFITAELLEANPIAKHLLGRRVGDAVEVEHGMRNKKAELQVLEVNDFYGGLWREIHNEINQNDTALPFESISFGTDNPTFEDINRTLLEVLGEGQRAQQQHAKQLLDKYRRYEATFFEVAANLHKGNFLEAYHWLTSNREDSPGLVVLSESVFPPIENLASKPIVLDWSSLPLLYALSTEQQLALPPVLWISQVVLENLREQVREKRRSKPVEMSVEIVDEQVRPHFYPPEMHGRQLAYLENLLAWAETNCKSRLVPEKLDIIRQGKSKTERQRQAVNYMADTACLAGAEHAVVVSDDAQLLELAAKSGAKVLSAEAFLKAYYPAQFTTCLLPALLSRSYIGLTISAQALLHTVREANFSYEGLALQALRNMVQRVFFAPEHLQEIAHFVREILTSSALDSKTSRYLAIRVLTAALCHTRLQENTLSYVATRLDRAFYLLPCYVEEVTRILKAAWRLAAIVQSKHGKKP
ncbi:PIN domain-containing protein [Hymenobacter aerophilus]|uniref:PIN domain-containing protein n=1 Tax=Hymenobacter aerophilus TaxID=119644 RepID=UPI000373B9ED|nr:hypothetical protein [Hymenobacter aerophilus]